MKTYFKVVCIVSVQMMQERPPSTRSSLTPPPIFTIALNTYNGDVAISPYTMPRVIITPQKLSLEILVVFNYKKFGQMYIIIS